MTEKCKKSVDKGKPFEALLKSYLKAINCPPHDVIIDKLNATRLIQGSICPIEINNE